MTGKAILVERVKDLPAAAGKGVTRPDANGIYYAAVDGKVEVKNGKIDVRDVHVVRGDVDMINGKIEFVGDVLIKGNVGTGAEIKAGRNITVEGTVEAATLTAGGSIILRAGIQGSGKALLNAKEDIYADFIEYTQAKAEGDIQANNIMNSVLSADKQVIITGKKGRIIGGYVHALLGIKAVNVGNPAEVRTILHVGYSPEMYVRFLSLGKKELTVEKQLTTVVLDERKLQQSIGLQAKEMSKFAEAKILELDKRKIELLEELSGIRKEKAKIQEDIDVSKDAQIKIDGNLYRGTEINIGGLTMKLEHSTCYMKYTLLGGSIVGSVIVR